MDIKKFFDLFDKNKFLYVFRISLILLIFLIVINSISLTQSKYESNAVSTANAKVAFFILEEGSYDGTVSLEELIPSDNAYTYKFLVSNYKDNQRCEVALKYTINFKVTTNIPLEYQIIRNEEYDGNNKNIIDLTSTVQDTYSVYYKMFNDNDEYYFGFTNDQTDVYTIVVNFPITYKNDPEKYQGLIDLFKITIDAQQVV